MIHQFDHRWATYERGGRIRDVTLAEKQSPVFEPLPRYWVSRHEVNERLASRWAESWLFGWRDIARATDERTTIASFLGYGAAPEGGTLLVLPDREPLRSAQVLIAVLNSYVFDFVARQKVGGTHLKFFTMRQLPVISPQEFDQQCSWAEGSIGQWIAARVGLLTHVSEASAAVSTGIERSPNAWIPEQRAIIRAEIDASLFLLYGLGRDEAEYVMETFLIAKRKDAAAYGEYRTKRLILEIYDALQQAIDTKLHYQTVLDLPSGEGSRHPTKGA